MMYWGQVNAHNRVVDTGGGDVLGAGQRPQPGMCDTGGGGVMYWGESMPTTRCVLQGKAG